MESSIQTNQQDSIIFLNTDRLIIRSLKHEDAQTFHVIRNNPLVCKYQSAFSQDRIDEMIYEMHTSHPRSKGKWYQFAIELKETNKFIGDMGFLNSDDDGKSWIGFTLDPDYWHKGLAMEAAKALLSYYSHSLDVKDIFASTDPPNLASQKLLQRMGFIEIDRNEEEFVYSLPNDQL